MTDTQNIVEEFKIFIEKLAEEGQLAELQAENTKQTDLYDLFIELTSLRSEVKNESRMVKSSLEEFKSVFDTLRTSQEKLHEELDRTNQKLNSQRQELMKPMFLEWLQIRDGMVATIQHLQERKSKGVWLFLQKKLYLKSGRQCSIESLLEGQQISLRKLDERLSHWGVQPIVAIGQPLDPHTMQVVSVDQNPQFDDGVVMAEIVTGFCWENKQLRSAQVIVNKLSTLNKKH